MLELKSPLSDDLWPQNEWEGVPEGEEPDWVSSEKEQLGTYRDKDGDGKLNRQEIGEWILPQVLYKQWQGWWNGGGGGGGGGGAIASPILAFDGLSPPPVLWLKYLMKFFTLA